MSNVHVHVVTSSTGTSSRRTCCSLTGVAGRSNPDPNSNPNPNPNPDPNLNPNPNPNLLLLIAADSAPLAIAAVTLSFLMGAATCSGYMVRGRGRGTG